MIEKKTLARPYAEAVFALAQGRKALESWSQMLAAMAVVASDARVQRLEDNPRVSDVQITQLFQDICGELMDKDGANVLRLLLENKRLTLLPNISKLFEQLKAEAEKTIEAEVYSALKLTAAQQKHIAESLKRKLGRDVTLVAHLDPSLLGGVLIRAGDIVIDGSVKGRLRAMASQLN